MKFNFRSEESRISMYLLNVFWLSADRNDRGVDGRGIIVNYPRSYILPLCTLSKFHAQVVFEKYFILGSKERKHRPHKLCVMSTASLPVYHLSITSTSASGSLALPNNLLSPNHYTVRQHRFTQKIRPAVSFRESALRIFGLKSYDDE